MSSTARADAATRATPAERPAPGDAGPPAGWSRTFSSLSNRNFRLLWLSMIASFAGLHMSFTTQGYLTYQLTGTATSLGLVGLGFGLPQLAFSLIGGVAADRLHKRWLMIASHCAMAIGAITTAVLIQTGQIEVWQVFLLALVTGTVFAFNVPARQAWIPELVNQEQLMNAIALNSSAFTAMSIVGPGLAGALIAVPFIGLTGSYYLMAGCYLLVVLMLLRIPGGSPATDREHAPPHQAMLDGLGYVRHHPILPFLIVIGFVPIVLGMPFRQFFPVFADEIYGVGSVGLGAMGMATGLGALVGSLWVASLASTSRRSLIQLCGGVGFGVTLVLFAVAPSFWPGIVALAFVGLMSNGYWALNSTMVLGNSNPVYYGRVQSVYMLSWSIQPFLGLPLGQLADLWGVQRTVAMTGVLVVLGVASAAAFLPGFRRLREQETSHRVALEAR